VPDIPVAAGENICDFCSQPNPERMFKVEDFTMDGPRPDLGMPEYRSKGHWAACSACGTMIDGEKWDELALRALDKLFPKYQSMMPRRILADTIRRSHNLFRSHYKAKP
jgi:hypothetical protein